MYKNIRLLNSIRNQYAHNLDAEILECDLNFICVTEPGCDLEAFKREETLPNMPIAEKRKNILAWISGFTFGYIHNHILIKYLGVTPD